MRFPSDVKAVIVADAEEKNRSVNDLAVMILAEWARVPFAATGRPYRGTKSEAGHVILRRVPPRVDQKLEAEKSRRKRGKTKEAVVVSIIAEHYGVAVPVAA